MTRTVLFLILLPFFAAALHAQPVQTIRGTVTDYFPGRPVVFASILLPGTHPPIGTVTDSSGNFVLTGVPVGRYDIRVSCAGYEPVIIAEVTVSSAKEIFLTAKMKQGLNLLEEVVIKPGISKEQPLNAMATVSARLLSVEEAQRYAGGFDDPARLVSAFAGVSGHIGNNAIVVRGNSPQALQWKMEGIEIPNPNHLGDMRVFGGGTVTALSSQLLANSDFLSGAMPAEYGNALSGVLDMYMRNGSNRKQEYTLQVGVLGIDAASEGPFKKDGRSSYLFNYRYSTLALVGPLLAENAGGIRYQDLSFKLNFPTRNAGTFSFWGMGLKDRVGAKAKRDIGQWVYDDDRENHLMKLYTTAAGISHRLILNDKQILKTILAVTANGINYPVEKLDSNLNPIPKSFLDTRYVHTVLSSFLNTKFSASHTNQTGINLTRMQYALHLQNSPAPDALPADIANETGNSMLISAYTSSTFRIAKKITINTGINARLFGLNHSYSIEPRAGIRHKFTSAQSIGLGYGLHSRTERLNYYFTGNAGRKKPGLTKAHHLVLGYDISTSQSTHLKTEAYYQYLFNVPVLDGSSFSMLNQQGDWFPEGPLQSTGAGKNYGLEMTFEKYLSKGYYYMATASVFRSTYRGGDRIWRNTRYDRNFVFNFLIGKEWFSGKNKQNVVGVNTRLNYQGGDRYSPVNTPLSLAAKSVLLDETRAFSLQYPAALTSHLTVSYKMNRESTSHTIALKIINLTQYSEYIGYRYNYRTSHVDLYREPVIIPNFSYRVDF